MYFYLEIQQKRADLACERAIRTTANIALGIFYTALLVACINVGDVVPSGTRLHVGEVMSGEYCTTNTDARVLSVKQFPVGGSGDSIEAGYVNAGSCAGWLVE